MKNILTIIGLSVALVASAAEPTKQPGTATKATVQEPVKNWSYPGGKIAIESFYSTRFSGDFDQAQQGIGVGVGYALTPHITASVRGLSYLDDPNGVNELEGRATYSDRLRFISDRLVYSAFTYGGANLQSGIGFGGAGGGLEFLFTENIGAGARADLRITTEWVPSVGIEGFLSLHF